MNIEEIIDFIIDVLKKVPGRTKHDLSWILTHHGYKPITTHGINSILYGNRDLFFYKTYGDMYVRHWYLCNHNNFPEVEDKTKEDLIEASSLFLSWFHQETSLG